MFEQKVTESGEICRTFLQVAVSNWKLYDSAKRKFLSAQGVREYKNSGKSTKQDMEDYVNFLAGIAVGDNRCLGDNLRPDLLIIREKQLQESQYTELFVRLWEKAGRILQESKTPVCNEQRAAILIPHTYAQAAVETGAGWLHLPFQLFQQQQIKGFPGLRIGTSVHSVEEAAKAQKLGAAYAAAGHIFSTDCKKDLPPRGTEFLEQICARVTIPVFAIGGVHKKNIERIRSTKAAGACRMSEYMEGGFYRIGN